jgi:hypothetical protein
MSKSARSYGTQTGLSQIDGSVLAQAAVPTKTSHDQKGGLNMLFRECKIVRRHRLTNIHCDVETVEFTCFHAQKWQVTQAEALYRMISMALAMEEGLVTRTTVP